MIFHFIGPVKEKKRNKIFYNKLTLIVSLLAVNGCLGCFDMFERTYWSDEKYEVIDDPGSPCKSLYYKIDHESSIGRVTCITRLGYNKEYIIASSLDPENNVEQFWIIPKAKDINIRNAVEVVEGPFIETAFYVEKRARGIENLEFTKNWSNN